MSVNPAFNEEAVLNGSRACAYHGSISMTSVGVRPQSAAGGHSANMWLKCLAVSVLIAVAASSEVFTNSFLVRFKRSVPRAEAHQVALRHGFDNLGPVSDHVMYVNTADAICRGIHLILASRVLFGLLGRLSI